METFSKLRLELDELGYTQTLKPECVPLVRKLLGDLKTTTENLCKYMTISKQAIEERDNLALGAEPYKCDNAKLIRECNELHLAFIQFKEKHEKIEEDLRSQISALDNQLKLCNTDRQKLKKNITELEIQLMNTRKRGEKAKSGTESTITSGSKTSGKGKGFQLTSTMALAEQKIAGMSQEVKKLKDEQLQYVKNNDFLKKQLQNRDDEIKRLNGLLEGGRTAEAVTKDCCYKNVDNKIGSMQDEISSLKLERNSLQNQLKETIAKQHEAMRRALHLAERNKQLEKEMKDIDQIALEVEAECNTKVRSNSEKVQRLQDRLNESTAAIQSLERTNAKLKQETLELTADLSAIKLEKKRLQSILEHESDDKKRLTDKINTFTIIEKDLNLEIDRLMRLSSEQKRKIAELEYQRSTTSGGLHSEGDVPRSKRVIDLTDAPQKLVDPVKSPSKSKRSFSDKTSKSKVEHRKTCKKAMASKQNVTEKKVSVHESVPPLMLAKCCCEAGGCLKNMKELLDKEMELRQAHAMQQIDSLKQEKEYYMKEYHRLTDEMRNLPTHDSSEKLHEHYEELLKTINEKNKTISELQRDLKVLAQEKNTFANKRDVKTSYGTEILDGPCQNITCKRKGRELEVHKDEMKYLEKENNALKEKIKTLNESTVFDQERLKKAFQDMEEHIRKLENERRDLIVNQCSERSNMSQLEEECHTLKEKLRAAQNELNGQKANYNQLKLLHDQTDRALTEAQNKVLRAETELHELHNRMQNSNRESTVYEKEIAKLQGDIEVMKKHLSKIDKEKDDLLNIVDEKTEKIDKLESQLQERTNVITNLEFELKELKRKLSKASEENGSLELQLRSSKQEVAVLEKDLENEKKLKDSAITENRRLQNDLSSVTLDCRDARKELEICRREVEDLKRQLQQYVAEVKRTEDLISQKEYERTEILDQFKSLSQEANILESNNHTLENEASQTRVQLSVALDHASDLERKLENQESIIRSYEKQIAELTSQVASLEIQMKQGNSQSDRIGAELKQLKDLCLKLDQEKDELKRELRNQNDQRDMFENSVDRLTKENRELKRNLDKEESSMDGLEKLLKEARQEVISQRLLNQDLQSEIAKMKSKMEDLQERLTTTTDQLDLYQEKALEYSQQNKQLRRDIANERFCRAREDDTKRYPSL